MALLTQDRKLTGTLGAAQDKVTVNSAGLATVTFQIPTGLTGTVTFEATDDDAASPLLVAIPATNVSTGTRATTAVNPAGIYRVDASGLRTVQVRCSAYTSGTTAVIANGSHAPFADPSGVSGGGGGGAVTVADGADVAQGTTTDAGIVTDTSGTVIGFLRGLVKLLIGSIKVVGPVAGGAAETGNSVSIGFVGTGGTHRNATAANSVTNTTGNDILGVTNLVKGTTNYFVQAGDDSGRAAIATGTIGPAKAEDAAHTSGDMGMFVLEVRNDTAGALAGTNLDYAPPQQDAVGQSRVVAAGYTTVITSTLTRPANTTAYTAGDEITDNGGAIITLSNIARYSGGSGAIQGLFLVFSDNWATKPTIRAHIFDTTSTPQTDNAAFAPSDAVLATCIGTVDLNTANPADATGSTGNMTMDSGQINIPFLTVGSANLFIRFQITNAGQAGANSSTITVRTRVSCD